MLQFACEVIICIFLHILSCFEIFWFFSIFFEIFWVVKMIFPIIPSRYFNIFLDFLNWLLLFKSLIEILNFFWKSSIPRPLRWRSLNFLGEYGCRGILRQIVLLQSGKTVHELRIGVQSLNPLQDGTEILRANRNLFGRAKGLNFGVPRKVLPTMILCKYLLGNQYPYQFVIFSIEIRLANPWNQLLNKGLKQYLT